MIAEDCRHGVVSFPYISRDHRTGVKSMYSTHIIIVAEPASINSWNISRHVIYRMSFEGSELNES